jgi:hypothetical protein
MGNMMNQATQQATTASTGTDAVNKNEILSLLKELGELKASGILTEEEFADKKRELLAKL